MARRWRDARRFGMAAGLGVALVVAAAVEQTAAAGGQVRGSSAKVAQQKAKKGRARKGLPAKPEAENPSADPEPEAAGGGEGLKFSRDIAPILAANCVGCHGGEKPKGEFDLSTFNKLMAGSAKGKVIVPGDPENSKLVQLVEAGEMPRGNDRRLADEAIERIGRWVKAGAGLDAKIDPAAPLAKIIPSPEARRREALSRLSAGQRDRQTEAAARERWKKALPDKEPATFPGDHFLLVGNLPKSRANATLKAMEAQYGLLQRLLSRPDRPALNAGEKITLFVFGDARGYVEFVRSLEGREVEAGTTAHANLAVEHPYLAAIDPLGGHEEIAAPRRPGRGRKAGDAGGPERSLAGLLTEQLATGAAMQAGQPPRWLAVGLGAYLASRVDARGPFAGRLRAEVGRQWQLGWPAKATEALDDAAGPEALAAMGFSLVEWLAAIEPAKFPYFVRGMLDGKDKLNDGIKELWGLDRDRLIEAWGRWVASRYGRGR